MGARGGHVREDVPSTDQLFCESDRSRARIGCRSRVKRANARPGESRGVEALRRGGERRSASAALRAGSAVAVSHGFAFTT